jgi:transposase-like protein
VVCSKCGSSESVKNGKRGNDQCYKCKNCDFQYTIEEPRRHSEAEHHKTIAPISSRAIYAGNIKAFLRECDNYIILDT